MHCLPYLNRKSTARYMKIGIKVAKHKFSWTCRQHQSQGQTNCLNENHRCIVFSCDFFLLLFALLCVLSLHHVCFCSLYSFSSPLLHLPFIFPLEILVLLTSICTDCFCQLFFFRSSFSVLQCNKYIEAINFYDFFFQTESYQEQKRGSLVCNGRLFCGFQNSSRSITQQQFTGGQFTCSKELIFSSYLYRIF